MNKGKFLLLAVALVAVIGAIIPGRSTPQDKIFTTDLAFAPCFPVNFTLEPNGSPVKIVFASLTTNCSDLHTIYQPL